MPGRRLAGHVAALQPERIDLPLCAPEPGPIGAGLKIIEDWVIERTYRAIQGVADDSGLGGETMQYQVQLDPEPADVVRRLGAADRPAARRTTTPTPAAGSIRRAASSTTCAGSDR